jgi:hypothetical protein
MKKMKKMANKMTGGITAAILSLGLFFGASAQMVSAYSCTTQTDAGSVTTYSQKYKEDLKLKDFRLPGGWTWPNPEMRICNVGDLEYVAHRTQSGKKTSHSIKIHVDKGDPPILKLRGIKIDDSTLVKDIPLPSGYTFDRCCTSNLTEKVKSNFCHYDCEISLSD